MVEEDEIEEDEEDDPKMDICNKLVEERCMQAIQFLVYYFHTKAYENGVLLPQLPMKKMVVT